MKKSKKILVIVAHPDDETIWMGGTLLKTRLDKTIISLCRRDDKDRAPRFKKACEIFNATGYMSDLEDETLKDIDIKEVIKRINKFTKGKHFDYLFTHGENGEYGHKRHIDVHKAVIGMLKNKILSAKKVFFFSYIKKGDFCNINKNADKLIRLGKYYFQRKKQLIQQIYGFEENSFENKCCKDIESFDIKK